MKWCNKCETSKPEQAFSYKNKARGILSVYCKDCQKVWRRAHYLKDKQTEYNRSRQYKKSQRDWLRKLKEGKACERCGFNHPAALQFHHNSPDAKLFNIAYAVNIGVGKQKILDEIAKCSVLCANCHMIEHHG